MARAIEAEEPDKLDERSALLTHHCEEAGELLEAARWSRRAAEWAGFSDPTEALRHWRAVRRLAAAAPESDDSARLALAACVWILRFGWRMGIPEDEASTAFEDGKRLAERNRNRHALARLFSEYAFFKAHALEMTDQTFDLVDQAQRLAREIGDPAFTLRIAPSWAPTYRSLGRPQDALRIIEEILEQAANDPGVGPGLVELRAYSLLLCTKNLVLLDLGRLDEVARLGEEVRRRAQEHGWNEILYWATEALAARAFYAGDAEGALRHARNAAELAEKIGARHARSGSGHGLGRAHLLAGRWSEAREALERSAEIGGSHFWSLLHLTDLAQAHLAVGDHESARTTIERVISVTQGRCIMLEALASLGLARILLGTEGIGATDRIEKALSDTWRISEELGSKLLLPHVHPERSQLAHLRGDQATKQRELRCAHRLYVETGATGHARRLAQELGN